jgi:hypothetical protein
MDQTASAQILYQDRSSNKKSFYAIASIFSKESKFSDIEQFKITQGREHGSNDILISERSRTWQQ